MIEVGTELAELLDEHRDGTIFADIEGDLWAPAWPHGWQVIHRVPFYISNQWVGDAGVAYGPYRAVLAAPTPRDQKE